MLKREDVTLTSQPLSAIVAMAAASLWAVSAAAQTGSPEPSAEEIAAVVVQPIRPIKMILAGDSTMQMGSGWGGRFCARRVSSIVACLNLARGGRSTTSYRREGSWNLVLGEAQSPGYSQVYVLIQFGHNDQHRSAERYADPARAYPDNLRRFVQDVRDRGATPILITPLTRRWFVNGKVREDLAPWAEAARQVARETNTPLLDLNADSVAAVQAMGPFMAAQLAPEAPEGDLAAALLTGTTVARSAAARPVAAAAGAPVSDRGNAAQAAAPAEPIPGFAPARQTFDYTHLGDFGAEFFSAMVTRELATAVPELRRFLYP